MSTRHVLGTTALLLGLASGPASAELLKYEFVGATMAATFFLDSLTPPSEFTDRPPQGRFAYFGVSGTFLENGVMAPAIFTVGFFNPFQHGGMDLFTTGTDASSNGGDPDGRFFASTDIVSTDPQAALFTGPVNRPTLLKGSFVLQDWFNSSGDPLLTYSLTVTAVPEPASWALLTLGVGALAWRVRRRAPAPTAA